MDIPQNLLEFKIGDQFFGIDGNKIEQILRVSSITPIPLSDISQKGVAVLSGRIVSILDLGIILDISEVDIDKDSTRLLTMNLDGVDYGFLVDEVNDITIVDKNNYENSKDETENIIGYYKKGEKICQILNFKTIINSLSLEEFSPQKLENMSVDNSEKIEYNLSEDEDRMLFFKLDDETFSVSISLLRELIFVPEEITPIPESNEFVMGMITLRGEVITTIDLRKIFEFNDTKNDEKSRLLIVEIEGRSLALLVDFVDEVKNINFSNLEELPEQFRDTKIEYIYKNKNNIASVISKLYLKKLISEYFIEENSDIKEENNNEREIIMNEMAVFSISSEEFAVDIQEVQEIIKYEEITSIPEAPQFIKGLINLRGVIIPIVSLPERLGFEENITEKSKILVCNIKDNKIGLLVDDVNEILFVEDKYVKKSDSTDTLFDEIITLNDGKRVILKLRARAILSDETLENIKMMDK